METFEFTRDQNTVLTSLARRLTFVGILIILTGVGRLALTLMRGQSEGLSADNLRHVVTAQGNDIAAVMTAMRELTGGLGVVLVLVIINAILLVAEIVGWGMR